MSDEIIYVVYSQPGGIDGMDHTDKGGVIVRATTTKGEAEKFVGVRTSWYRMAPEVHDLEVVANAVFAKLNKLELLAVVRHAKLAESRLYQGNKPRLG